MSFRIATGDVSFSLNWIEEARKREKKRTKREKNLVEDEVVNKDKLNLNGIEIIYLNNWIILPLTLLFQIISVALFSYCSTADKRNNIEKPYHKDEIAVRKIKGTEIGQWFCVDVKLSFHNTVYKCLQILSFIYLICFFFCIAFSLHPWHSIFQCHYRMSEH